MQGRMQAPAQERERAYTLLTTQRHAQREDDIHLGIPPEEEAVDHP